MHKNNFVEFEALVGYIFSNLTLTSFCLSRVVERKGECSSVHRQSDDGTLIECTSQKGAVLIYICEVGFCGAK